MLKNRKKLFSLILVVVLVFTIAFLLRSNAFKDSSKELINVNKLSKKYMDNYFAEVKKIKKENLDNTLIVISKKHIKNGYGAKKIISAPNNQYYLIFDDETKMNNAKNKLKSERGIISVDQNHKLEFFDDEKSLDKKKDKITKTRMTYSWGYRKMALDERLSDDVDFKDVTVAVIDSGVDLDLFNKYFENQIEETYNVYDDKEMYDENGHGTHVAGIIADGTSGTNTKILPIKQTSGHFVDEIYTIAALNWVTYNNKADVINMSFGGPERTEALYQAIEAAYEENIIMIAAAGNSSDSMPMYPAAFNHTISVGSVDEDFNLSDFSNYGDTIDYVAPGEDIYSIMGVDSYLAQLNIIEGHDDHDPDFETMSGTSMAAPHMASTLAIFKAMNKDITLEQATRGLNRYAIDLGPDGKDPYFGRGFVNLSIITLCRENYEVCDYNGVFKNYDAPRIFWAEPVSNTYESLYNFGNETNLMDMKFKLYYNDDEYIIKELGDSDDFSVENYDPYTEGEQEIRVYYQGWHNITVNNHANDGYSFVEEDEDTIRLDSMNTSQYYPKTFIVPETYHGKEIVSIGSSVFSNKDIKKVKILPELKTIENGTFSGCDKLRTVELPDSVETIEGFAFAITTALTSIDLPNGLQEIGVGAFKYSGLNSITIPSTVRVVPREGFAYCGTLIDVEIEDGVTEIQSEAFKHDPNLKSIYIPASVTNIDYDAFGGNYSMTDIDLDERNTMYESEPDTATIIDKTANKVLYANDNSVIPDSVGTIGPYAISAFVIRIPENITALDNNALTYAGEVVYPQTIRSAESVESFTRDEGSGVNYVYANSFVHNYLSQNDLPYNIIDSERVQINEGTTEYNAFDKADLSVEKFGITTIYDTGSDTYDRPHTKITGEKNYEISYQHGTDYFRGDDEYFIVSFDSEITGNHYDERVNVTVNKLTPEYTAPTNLTGGLGSKLSTVKLPDGFEWMDGTQKMNSLGENTYKAKFIPEDTINYETIENIDVIVRVINNKTVITPTITLTNKTYDGTSNIPMENIRITNLDEDDYTIVSATASSSSVGQTTATIRLKLSDAKFERYSFEDGKQEEDYVVYFEILKAEINVTDSTEDKTVDYDGNEHSITVHADYPSNATLRYMDSNGDYTLTNPPKYTEAGIYVIKYRISINENYESYYGERTLIIEEGTTYEINKYVVDEDDHLIGKIMVGTDESTFTSNITLGRNYSVEVDYKVVNNKHLLYTGGKTKIYKNSNLIVEYTNVVVGDVSGDAKINSADILLMRQHMLGINTLSGAKYSAANINYDNNVNSADLLRIRQHLLDILPIS